MRNKTYKYGLVLISILSFLDLHSQEFTATQNWLTGVDFNTCMQRSKEIMNRNGYTVEVQSNGIGLWGLKQNVNAWLTCQPCADKTITTIILGNLPNTNMVQLRESMLNFIATGLTGTSTGGTGNFYTIKNVFNPGERIVIEFKNFPGNSSDWINIVPIGSGDGIPGTWQYTNGKKDGQVSLDPQAAGEYEARGFYNNSYKVEYRHRFRVGTGISVGGENPPNVGRLLKLDKTKFAVNEKIEIHFFNLAGNSSDWISIVPKGTPEGAAGNWQYTGGLKNGKLTFAGIAAGEYETRVFYNNSYKVEDRLFFKVENP